MKKPAPKRTPIKVSNPKDKRLRAYNDSNELYNSSNNYRNALLKNSISPIKNEIVLKDTKTLDKIRKNIPYSKTGNDKIRPIAYYDIGVGKNKKYNESALYEKPVQPYKLEKKKPVAKTPVKSVEKPAEPKKQTKAESSNRVYYSKGSVANMMEDVPSGFYTKEKLMKANDDAIKARLAKKKK
jgi:hypothetical protein